MRNIVRLATIAGMMAVAAVLASPAFACVGSVCVCWHNICV